MKKDFIGREKELNFLKKVIHRNGFDCILIYGRRRLGKSELIKQILKTSEIPSVYYECKQTAAQDNISSFLKQMSETFDIPYRMEGYADIESVLELAFKNSRQEQMILVLDEYPYLKESIRGMDSILQTLIDSLQKESQLKIILCGSYVETMTGLISSHNPLHGRITSTLEVKPMDYFDAAKFYPAFSHQDKVRIYSVFGGVPYYNQLIDESLSVRENIIQLIASNGARLELEISYFLKGEMRKISNANSVFTALANGKTKFKDIQASAHIPSPATLSEVLEKLMKMGLVEKVSPINDRNNLKKSGYYISDPLSRFYYRYIFANSSQMANLEANLFYDRYIHNDFESQFIPHAFEKQCREFLLIRNKNNRNNPPFDLIGKYWYDDPVRKKNGEFDVVTSDPEGYVFYEAKFRNSPLSLAEIEDEMHQVQESGLSSRKYGFISSSGFKCNCPDACLFFTLDDLYNEKMLF